MNSSNEENMPSSISDEERSNLDSSHFLPFQNTVKSMNFNIFDENPDFLGSDDNLKYIPSSISDCLKDLNNESQNDILYHISYIDKPNDYNILDINPSQNDRDYFAQKIDIEKENAISIEGKFFLNSLLIPLGNRWNYIYI